MGRTTASTKYSNSSALVALYDQYYLQLYGRGVKFCVVDLNHAKIKASTHDGMLQIWSLPMDIHQSPRPWVLTLERIIDAQRSTERNRGNCMHMHTYVSEF